MMRTASPLELHPLKGDPYHQQSRVKATRPLKISFNEKRCSLYACVHILFHWLAYVLSKSPRVLSQEQVHSFPLLNLNHDDENKRAASLMTVRELLLPAIRAAFKGKKIDNFSTLIFFGALCIARQFRLSVLADPLSSL
jgi:hypothetical protein